MIFALNCDCGNSYLQNDTTASEERSLHCHKDLIGKSVLLLWKKKQDFLIFWTIRPEPYVLKTRAVLGSVGIWAGLL